MQVSKGRSESTITLDGEKNISVTSDSSITLSTGKSSISMKSDGTINIEGENITINGVQNSKMISGGASFSATSSGGKADVTGTDSTVHGGNTSTLSGQVKTTVTAVGQTIIGGAIVKLN